MVVLHGQRCRCVRMGQGFGGFLDLCEKPWGDLTPQRCHPRVSLARRMSATMCRPPGVLASLPPPSRRSSEPAVADVCSLTGSSAVQQAGYLSKGTWHTGADDARLWEIGYEPVTTTSEMALARSSASCSSLGEHGRWWRRRENAPRRGGTGISGLQVVGGRMWFPPHADKYCETIRCQDMPLPFFLDRGVVSTEHAPPSLAHKLLDRPSAGVQLRYTAARITAAVPRARRGVSSHRRGVAWSPHRCPPVRFRSTRGGSVRAGPAELQARRFERWPASGGHRGLVDSRAPPSQKIGPVMDLGPPILSPAEASLTAAPLLPPASMPLLPPSSSMANHRLEIGGYPVKGVSIGGKETCPSISAQRAVSQEFLVNSGADTTRTWEGPHVVEVAARSPSSFHCPACLRDLVVQLFECSSPRKFSKGRSCVFASGSADPDDFREALDS
ncbi:hypothetical protein HU200_046953 [Digitaria exilis]|uniref:Uncharacterized protein n=1 Tax=Digitaria exilis TaxID=1010633 RepID=A0A835AXD1_9POAL|nr:hypothetical protein HU200_046953 [Digitaria exilis]